MKQGNNQAPDPHPLRERLARRGVPLWRACAMCERRISEGTLSRMLRGIQKMPPDVEKDLSVFLQMEEADAA